MTQAGFVLDASPPQRFAINAAQWSAFLAAFDAPPRDLPRLERLFRESTPFEPPRTLDPFEAERSEG